MYRNLGDFTRSARSRSVLGKRSMKYSLPSSRRFKSVPRAVQRRNNVRTAGYLGIERKFFDKEFSQVLGTTIATASVDPASDSLNGIVQGNGESERDGRKCVMKKIEIEGTLIPSTILTSAAPLRAAYIKLALVLDTQTNAAAMTPTDYWTGTYAYMPRRNMLNIQRFKTLWEKEIVLQPGGGGFNDAATTGALSHVGQRFKFSKNINIPVNYVGTTDAIASISDNSLHLMGVCSSNTAPEVTCIYTSRVTFVG